MTGAAAQEAFAHLKAVWGDENGAEEEERRKRQEEANLLSKWWNNFLNMFTIDVSPGNLQQSIDEQHSKMNAIAQTTDLVEFMIMGQSVLIPCGSIADVVYHQQMYGTEEAIKEIPWVVLEAAGFGVGFLKTTKASRHFTKAVNLTKSWLGNDAKVIINKSDDVICISKDRTRRLRFNINNPHPHKNPHSHIEELIDGRWVKSGPLYPKNIQKP